MIIAHKPRSLTAQIDVVERRLSNRRQRLGIRTVLLSRKIRQQMTAPATLLLATGIGFMLGELTKRRTAQSRNAADKPRASETTPLKIALNLLTSARTLYAALPIVWVMKSYFQPENAVASRVNTDIRRPDGSPPLS